MLQTKAKAIEAAKSQMRAANASLKAVEEGIQLHANNRDYAKLKEIAEASGLAAKVCAKLSLAQNASFSLLQHHQCIHGLQALSSAECH